MAEEVVEIELVSPAGSGEWVDEEAQAGKVRETKETEEKKSLEIELVAAFDAAARKRNSFAMTDSQRKHRVERFEQALKAIAKRMSAQAANHVSDREARSEVRIQVYRGLMLLLNQLGRRQEASAASARRALKWGFGVAGMGLLGMGITLVATGALQIPL